MGKVESLLDYRLAHPHGHTRLEVNEGSVIVTFTPKNRETSDNSDPFLDMFFAWRRAFWGF